ncbi:GNAT family N-acetyltransferase [Candidatus Poribacteria bacterium]|jgi:predicted N-acetyltransferase YhbS|nr:GNAT family N-acetyltransferase [Candidatus Poribacteria bacterium]MBT5709905.1 GNAT family N-acetyltransferase [Candidatus Poribacteria bacterium]MBT7096528.1 GNAT family N-acetyltransferase [Candidatus Poribacteria bacterium]MBT7806513.1 GNAT family N-acetyltransferase [Candidatus Poribacteria bacterium]
MRHHTEIRAATPGERPEICHLIDVAFDAEPHGPSLTSPCTSVGSSAEDPHDRPDNTRILVADGKIVSVVHMAYREAHVRGARVSFGYVSMVATHPDHRRNGYMRRLMRDAEESMRDRGLCYALLMGAWDFYGGSLGWRPCDDKAPSLAWKYVARTDGLPTVSAEARMAAEADIPALAHMYDGRYAQMFGPVVRSREYWRRWSLGRPWEGSYAIVSDAAGPLGYFHTAGDEYGCEPDRGDVLDRVFLARARLAARSGEETASYYLDGADMDAFRQVFGDAPRTYVDPLGRPVTEADRDVYRLGNWAGGCGVMVRCLNRGSGILSDATTTDALTSAMARLRWTYLDADSM